MPNEGFTLSDITAVADWRPPGEGGICVAQHPIKFSIEIDVLRKTVAFRARVSVSLKASRPKVPLYLIITPDRIISVEPATIPEHATSSLRADVAGLRFQLSDPGVAVVPSRLELVPKNKDSGNALEMIQAMARAADITFYLPRASLSNPRQDSLCRVSRDWAPALSLSDIPTLYLGQGGTILDHDVSPAAASPPAAESPPSYDELAPTPPAAEPSSLNAKRRRLDDRMTGGDTSAIENTCRRIFEEQREELAGNIEKTLRQQLREEMELDDSKRVELLRGELKADVARSKEELRAEVKRDLETSVLATLEERLDGKLERLRDELREELAQAKDEAYQDKQDAIDEADNLIHSRLDERITDVKVELTDWADEEVRRIEEETWQKLSQATWTMNSP